MTKQLRVPGLALGLAAALLAASPVALAFNFGDMMNPSRWMGGNNDDDYDYGDYYGGPWGPGYGYGAPYGYGVPGYGVPGYGAPGYGVPGYGVPGYGVPGYGVPAYGAPAAVAPAAPAAAGSDAKDQEIEALKRRIDQLENRQPGPPPVAPPAAGADGWPSAPAFRPMDPY